MSTIEAILFRTISDAAFANLLFTQPDKALADYHLTAEEAAQFKGLRRAESATMPPNGRKSMESRFHDRGGR